MRLRVLRTNIHSFTSHIYFYTYMVDIFPTAYCHTTECKQQLADVVTANKPPHCYDYKHKYSKLLITKINIIHHLVTPRNEYSKTF